MHPWHLNPIYRFFVWAGVAFGGADKGPWVLKKKVVNNRIIRWLT